MLLLKFFADHYLSAKPSTSARTVKLYKHTIRKYSQWLGHRATFDDLTNQLVGKYLGELYRGKSLSPASINKERSQLCAMWRMANTLGMVAVGPIVQPVKEPERTPKALTIAELRQLTLTFDKLEGSTIGVPNSDYLRAIFNIQYYTAERIGAVMRLRWSDVTPEAITFRAETRKGGRKTLVRAVPAVVGENLALISKPKREQIFFTGSTNYTKVFKLYERLFDRAGVVRPKGRSSHLLRSSHATHLELAGGDPTKSLGHSSRGITVKHYLDPRFNLERTFEMLPELGVIPCDETK